MNKSTAFALFVSCVILSSCSYIWTYKLLPSERYEQPDLKGWIFSTDIKTTIRVGRGEDSLLAKQQRFLFGLKFELPKKKEVKNIYDIGVERVSIKYYEMETEKALSVNESFYGSAGYKEMDKYFSLVPVNPRSNHIIDRRTLFIPLEVDSAFLTFDAVLREGIYTTTPEDSISTEGDTIIVFDNVEPIRIPMAVVLFRKTTKEGAIGLVPGH